ncbi:UNVERIFIED_CONTAM: hypothetical protein FKN15_016687 [Acipenser sinensis]
MVKAGKLRSGTAQKLKRWKKGHSSESNPETSRYRQAARSRFFSRPSVRSDLTVDALKLHNDLQSGPLEHKETKDDTAFEVDEPALTEQTSATFLSGLSDCSNLTFSKVQRFWESNSAAHKEICAVLAAVTEVIRSQGGKETETEYFAALMTTLEAVESSESVGAVAYLLNLVLKRVPSPVLSLKFSDTSKVFMNIMSSQASSESPSALRWILSCLANLLRKQDASVWSYPSTLQVYHGLLSFTVHSKPKVRKAAQHGVCSILRGSDFMFGDSAPSHHPAAQSTARFCIKEMEQAGGNKEDTTVLHILGLLKELLPCFPHGAVKSCCETLLRVMTLSHVLVTAGAMQAFHKLFSAKPNSSSLPAELNAQIITALYDYLPSENDLQPLLAWLAVMEKAHTHLSSLQISLCLGHLPRLFTAAMTCFLSPHVQVVSTAAQTLKTLLKECVAPCLAEIGSITSTAPCGSAAYICKMFRLVEEGLTYRYYSSWPFVMQVLSCFYQVAGKEAHPIMVKSLQSLCDLRLTPRFPFSGELDQTVGSAVESMGPEIVLRAIPLQIDGNEDDLEFPRSWLIPVIRDRVKNTELGFFTTYLLPLATTLKNKADELSQAGRNLESKVYMTLHLQIWSMLPGFCMQPTDLATSFKGIARALGMVIGDRSDLRLTVCHAIRTLINKSIRKAEDHAEVARFAKNFLPILFNVYTQQPAAVDSAALRMPVLDTIKMYLTITDQESKESGLQKKAYRILEEMCGGEREPCRQFVLTNLEELKRTLLGSLKSASSPAKRVMICTNEVAVGARRNAYTLLVEIGRAFIRFCGSQKEAILQYLELIYAGFTGSVTMISCTVLALTRLVYEFKDSLERSVIEPLLRNVCLLLSSRTREVVKTALSFVKVILFIMDVKVLATHMPLLMEGIGNIKEDMRRHFRTKLKNIFTKFIRKFGFELVKNMLPEEYHKVLVNIRKVEARNKQRKTLKHDANSESENEEDTSKPKGDSIEDILADSEDEDEEEKKGRGGKKQPAQKGKAWLKEGEGDEPLNFLDPMVSQRVLATNPDVKKNTKVRHDFKLTSDGRLIIREEADDDEKSKGAKEEMEDILEEAGVKSKNQKRKFKEGNLDEDMEMEPQFQYKAGGSGIHRPLSRKGDSGGQYKAKSGKGDIKKKGQHDPYAYIPLKKAQLNRRAGYEDYHIALIM